MTDPKYVNNGTYGCVMRPGVPCKRGRPNDSGTISKLFADKVSAAEEIILHNKIVNKIDPEGAFTIKLVDYCQIANPSFRLHELGKCGNFSDKELQQHQFYQIIYEYGGYDLDACTRKFKFEDLFRAMHRIFKGLITMEKHGYIHVDIKPPNIVYNPETQKMALIDFGMAMKSSELYVPENDYIFDHPYPYYPPEFKAISAYYNETKSVLKNILKNWELDITPRSDKEMNNFYSFIQSAQQHLNKKLPFNKVDVYMLGVTLHEIFHNCRKRNTAENNSFYAAVINLVDKMTYYDPRVRLSPTEAYAEYKKVLAMIGPVSPDGQDTKPVSVAKKRAPEGKKPKDCPEGKVRNPKTGRCIKVAKPTSVAKPASVAKPTSVAKPAAKSKDCPEGKVRNPKTGRCINPPKEPKSKDCPEGKVRNPKTGRCINPPKEPKSKDCPEGKVRNPKTGRCINHLKEPKSKDCPEGKVRNPKTGRCIKARE